MYKGLFGTQKLKKKAEKGKTQGWIGCHDIYISTRESVQSIIGYSTENL